MKKNEIENLVTEIEAISSNFEDEAYTENIRLLKDGFDLKTLGDPKQYLEFIATVDELARQGRLLFLYSIFNRVCDKEGVLYQFKKPYQANMEYSAVLKIEGNFYILDEDNHHREIFCSEKFARFIEDEYWELIEK